MCASQADPEEFWGVTTLLRTARSHSRKASVFFGCIIGAPFAHAVAHALYAAESLDCIIGAPFAHAKALSQSARVLLSGL